MMTDSADNMMSFFQKEAPSGYLESCSQQLAQAQTLENRTNQGAMILKLGKEYMAWSSLSCLTVLSPRPIHSIPHRSHPVFKGMSAVNGTLIPCFSLMRLLHIEETLPVHQQAFILMGEGHQMSGMLVEHIETYIRFHQDNIASLPSSLSQEGLCFSQGLLDWKGQSIPLLDEKLVMLGFERCMQ